MRRWRWFMGLVLVLAALGLSWPEAPWRLSCGGAGPVPLASGVGSVTHSGPRAEQGAPAIAADKPLSIQGTTLNLMERPLANVELLALRVPEVRTPRAPICAGEEARSRKCKPTRFERDELMDELESSPEPEVVRARSTADGRFELGGLRPGLYELWAEAPHGVAVQTLAAGTVGARLILAEGVLAAGRLMDEAKVPLAGVRVALWSPKRVRHSLTRTSESGRYSFFRVPEEEYQVVSSKEGFLSAVMEAHPAEYVEALIRPRTLEGRVVRQGAGIGGVQVQLDDGKTSGRTATSDPDGHFAFDDLPPGSVSLEVVSEQGWASAQVSLLSAEPPGPTVLDLHPCAALEGRVVEERSRQPIAGAVARFLLESSKRGSYLPTREVPTDSRGFFRFECPPQGSFKLSATAKGFMEALVANVPAPGAGASRSVEVTLEAAAPFEGRVVDPEGRAIEGARVGVQWGYFAASHAEKLRDAPPSVFSTWSTTGAEGAFTLDGLGPGFFVLHILAPPGFKNGAQEVTLPLTGGRFVLERTTSVRGTVLGVVVDELGRPRSNVHVRGEPTGEELATVEAWTDALGMFRFDDLATGPLTLTVSYSDDVFVDDFVVLTTAVDVRGEAPAEVRLELAEGQNLAVLVEDERGAPVAGAHVSFSREEPDLEHGRYVGEDRTRAQGRALLRHLRAGSYYAEAEGDGWQPSAPVRLGSGGSAARIVLRPSARPP